MTELKTNQTFIKGSRTKIKNQKNNDWHWNTKNKEDKRVFFRVKERKEWEKKEMTTDDKQLIIHHHTSH
jgi:hypothetical protein